MEEGRKHEVNLLVNLCLKCMHGGHYRVASKAFWRRWASSGSLISYPRDLEEIHNPMGEFAYV